MHVYKYTHGYIYLPKYAPLLPTLLAHGIAILGKKNTIYYYLYLNEKVPSILPNLGNTLPSVYSHRSCRRPQLLYLAILGHFWLLEPPGRPFQGKKLYRHFSLHIPWLISNSCQPVPPHKNHFDCVYGHGAHFVKRSKSIPEIKAFVLPKYSSDVVLSIIKLHFASSHVLINFRPFFLILFLDCEPPSSGRNFLTDFVIGH